MRLLRWATRVLAAGLLLALAQPAAADGLWSGSARLGLLATGGNTERHSFNARLVLEHENLRWVNRLNISADGAREEDRATAEAYELGGRTAYDFSQFDFAFARASWRRDRFSSYDRQVTQSLGYGHRLLDTGRQHLNLEVGGGARQAKLRDGSRGYEAILRLASDYEYRLTDDAALSVDLSMESGEDNTVSEATTELRSKVFGRMALVVSFRLRNNSHVPESATRTDSYTSISMEYAFP